MIKYMQFEIILLNNDEIYKHILVIVYDNYNEHVDQEI